MHLPLQHSASMVQAPSWQPQPLFSQVLLQHSPGTLQLASLPLQGLPHTPKLGSQTRPSQQGTGPLTLAQGTPKPKQLGGEQ
jgi:hypothetical protein